MKAKFFVQFKAELYDEKNSWGGNTAGDIKGIKAVKITQNNPVRREGDLTVEFEVEFPETLIIPKVTVTLDDVGSTVKALRATERELST